MTCKQYEKLECLLAENTPLDSAMNIHAAQCQECRRLIEAFHLAGNTAKLTLQFDAPGDSIRRNVMRQIKIPSKTGRPGVRHQPVLILALLAAAALFGVLYFTFWFGKQEIASYDNVRMTAGEEDTGAPKREILAESFMYCGNAARTCYFKGGLGSTQPDPAIKSLVYVVTIDGKLLAIDPLKGAVVWRLDRRNEFAESDGEQDAEEGVSDVIPAEESYRFTEIPVVLDGKIYVGSVDHGLFCIDAKTGKILWNFSNPDTPETFESSPAVVGGRVFSGSKNDRFVCLDAKTGKLIWSYETGRFNVTNSPAIAGNIVYFASRNGVFHAVSADKGHELWNVPVNGNITSSPAVAGGMVYFGTSEGSLVALEADTGATEWTFETGFKITGAPAVDNGLVFIGAKDKALYAIDAKKGELKWKHDSGGSIPGSAAAADGTVYFGGRDKTLYALDALSGDVQWSMPVNASVVFSVAVSRDLVLVGTSGAELFAFDRVNKKQVWSMQISGGINASPVIAD